MYLEGANYYVMYQGKLRNIDSPLDDREFYQEWAGKFYNSAMYFVNYLENEYPDEVLQSETVIDLDVNKMIERMDSTTYRLFSKPTYPSLIFINESMYFTHFHTDGKVIDEAEGIEVLPGLSRILANNKINKLFNGLTPTEARELLKQMDIYPKDTELDNVIGNYNERLMINQLFLKSIICLLLIRRSTYGVNRARLFADCLDINFDFEPYEDRIEQSKNLEYKNKEN